MGSEPGLNRPAVRLHTYQRAHGNFQKTPHVCTLERSALTRLFCSLSPFLSTFHLHEGNFGASEKRWFLEEILQLQSSQAFRQEPPGEVQSASLR